MSTIDQLAPATSVSDADEIAVSQGGTAKKATRKQILNGVQTQILIPAGSLLGRVGTGTGITQAISVGKNLSFNGSTLSATAGPFVIGSLPAGHVPATGDLIAVSQAGTAVAVTYGQFLNGIANQVNIDVSHAVVKPTGAPTSQTLGDRTAVTRPPSNGDSGTRLNRLMKNPA